jgi:hypothetical protein
MILTRVATATDVQPARPAVAIPAAATGTARLRTGWAGCRLASRPRTAAANPVNRCSCGSALRFVASDSAFAMRATPSVLEAAVGDGSAGASLVECVKRNS